MSLYTEHRSQKRESQLISLMEVIDEWDSQVVLVVKNPLANAGDIRDAGSERSLGGGHGNPPQHLPGESHGQWRLVGYCPQGFRV